MLRAQGRFRSGVQRPAGRQGAARRRGHGVLGGRRRARRPLPPGLPAQHAYPAHRDHRRRRRRPGSPRLRPTFPALRPRLSADRLLPCDPPSGRHAAHHHPPAPDGRLGRGPGDRLIRVEPCALRCAGPDSQADHQRSGVPCRRRTDLPPGGAIRPVPGSRRAIPGRGAGRGQRRPGRHGRLLARMGAHPGHAPGLAGRGDPRRDHLEALRLRGDRGHRRGDDHLDPRGAGQRPQLGLPLLLDP